MLILRSVYQTVLSKKENFFSPFASHEGNWKFLFSVVRQSPVGQGLLVVQASLSHTTFDKTPLDEWSARRRKLYLTTLNTLERQISMPLAGVKPAIAASERRQTHVLDHAATQMGWIRCMQNSALNINMLSAWGPGRFAPKKGIHGTNSVEVRVGPRCDKDVGRRKYFLAVVWIRFPNFPAHSLFRILTALPLFWTLVVTQNMSMHVESKMICVYYYYCMSLLY